MGKADKLPQAARQVIEKLGLQESFEGVYLWRVYESSIKSSDRPQASSIYALAAKSAPSRLHRLDCDEIWHFYAGCPLDVFLFADTGLTVCKLGSDVMAGQQPQLIVPKGTIFGALVEQDEDWCLFGCTCVPGFVRGNCEFIKGNDPVLLPFAEHRQLIEKLTGYEG